MAVTSKTIKSPAVQLGSHCNVCACAPAAEIMPLGHCLYSFTERLGISICKTCLHVGPGQPQLRSTCMQKSVYNLHMYTAGIQA